MVTYIARPPETDDEPPLAQPVELPEDITSLREALAWVERIGIRYKNEGLIFTKYD